MTQPSFAVLLAYLKARRELALAESALLDEQIKRIEEMSDATGAPPAEFNPVWKSGSRLTTRGRQALEAAFEHGLRQVEVARLFHLSVTRVNAIHREWRDRNGHAPPFAVDESGADAGEEEGV